MRARYFVMSVCGCLLFAGCDTTEPRSTPTSPSLTSATDEVSLSGGGKVDSACGGSDSCSDTDREDNTIVPGSSAIFWVVDGSSTFVGYSNCSWFAYDKGSQVASGGFTGETLCTNARGFYFTAPNISPGTSGSLTIDVWCNSVRVGTDSYRSISNPSCFK